MKITSDRRKECAHQDVSSLPLQNGKFWPSRFLSSLILMIFIFSSWSSNANAACGATTLQWYADAGSTVWGNNNNWTTTAPPTITHVAFPQLNTQNALITSDWFLPAWPAASYNLSCVSIASGTLTATPAAARTLTVSGDYFRNLNLNSLTTNNFFTIIMAGTAAQTFENVDAIDNLTISNSTSVDLTQSFSVKSTGAFTISAASGTVYISKDITLNNAGTALVIPASATLEVRSGATLVAMGGITVNGTLKINAGGQVLIGTGRTLNVAAGGVLLMAGSSGNVATLSSYNSGTFTFTVAGSANLNNFSISRTTAAGMNVTGTIQTLTNGDFHYPAASGYAITLGAAATSPSTWTSLGFFNDANAASVKNVNATAYVGSVITVSNWSGNGGAVNATDPGAKLSWGSAAAVALQIQNATVAGSPATTVAAGSTANLFATFGLSLTGTSTATDITSMTFTLGGLNTAADVTAVKVYNDTNGNCLYNAGTDLQIGASLVPAGTPAKVTVTIPASTITLSSTTQKCIHVVLDISSSAQNNDTINVEVVGTADVSNSLLYSFSNAGGPPVSGSSSTVTGGPVVKSWNGGNAATGGTAQLWNANAGDWTASGTPVATNDIRIPSGYSYPRLNANQSAVNVSLVSSGTLDMGTPTAFTLNIAGSLTAGTPYTFNNATLGILNFNGSANQSINFQPTWPGSITINSTGGKVTVNNDWTIAGDLTLTTGTLTVSSGYTLTVGGNVTINGGTLEISPGATLKFSTTGKTLTVGAAGTLQLVGSTSQNSMITSSTPATAYTMAINGTIKAQYYSVSRLGVAGLTINSGATIDPTYYLQNGSFNYPIGTNPVMLTLNRQIPGNALANMTFDLAGSAATGSKSIVTSAAAGTLAITNYNGSLTNCCTTAPTYLVTWASPVNTIKLTQEATSPASAGQGVNSVNMGRFGFQQTQAGAYADTNLTSVKLTLTGTGSGSDISAVRLYYDAACTGTGGILLGTGTFSGSPSTITFSSLSAATVQFSSTAPPKRCLYVEYDVASGATSGATLGVQITASSDVVNSLGYAFNGAFAPQVTLGTAMTVVGTTTTWTGTTNTAWAVSTNWTGGLPSATLNCVINSATNNPIISVAGAVCKSLTIGNGNLTINTGQNLDLYGSLTNTGTLTQAGTATLTVRDTGTASNQTIQSASALTLAFNKTLGGIVYIGNSALTLNNFAIPAAQNFTFQVQSGDTLTLPNGATMTSGTFRVDGGGVVKVASAQTITVNGGTFYVNGTNDTYPQATSNKGQITNNGGTTTWAFNATSGTVNLTGFLFDWLDVNGLVIGGTTILSNLNGGQFRNLSTTYTSVKGIQINTTGSIPAVASNVGWNWSPTNIPPGPAVAYLLARSTGCASQTITFDQWFGDFFVSTGNPNTSTKVSAVSCTINIAAAASPVNLTQLSATPYNGAVVLNWTTGLEFLHQGFNVYRSLSPDGGFAQINGSLLRNSLAAGSIHGQYQFFDNHVTNGVTYYYQIEDIAVVGTRTIHGPLSAKPMGTLAMAPPANPGAITGSNGDPTSAPVPVTPGNAPGQKVIANGVTLLAHTAHSLRIKIDIPALAFSPDGSNPSYSRVSAPGYSVMTNSGLPELPQRTVMIEIPNATSAARVVVSQVVTALTNVNVAPAPAWTPINGSLVPSWNLDSTFYATNQTLPTSPIVLEAVTQNRGSTYLPLVITPLLFNPVTRNASAVSQVIVDIFLSGSSSWTAPIIAGQTGPWEQEGGLKISVKSKGLHQLTYDDLVSAGVEGPFQGADTNKLRLFRRGTELPIEVLSSGLFSSGDKVRFYSPEMDQSQSNRDVLLLIVDPSVNGLRMANVAASPAGAPVTRLSTFLRSIHFEENHLSLFAEPVGENYDHIFWGRFYSPPVSPGDDQLSATVNLPNLIPSGTVHINGRIKGSPGPSIINLKHHLRMLVNGIAVPSADLYFQSNSVTTLDADFPASLFVPGSNVITFRSMGDFSGGDYDIINLDYFDLTYPHDWMAEANSSDVNILDLGRAFNLGGFTTSNIVAYDVTAAHDVKKLTSLDIFADGTGGFNVSLALPLDGSNNSHRVRLLSSSQYLQPSSIELNKGSHWHSPSQGADVIYIGSDELLSAISPLAEFRTRQGYRVEKIDIESIYSEFGLGERNDQAIKNFLKYAKENWPAPSLKYVVLVGDGTYDPKNNLGFERPNMLPVHYVSGLYTDYVSDNWFVSYNPNDAIPSLAIGRIPADSASKVTIYVNKILGYENGPLRPDTANVALIADRDQIGGEEFVPRTQSLSAQISSWNQKLVVSKISRTSLTDAQMKQSIVDAFNSSPIFLNYFGHGAENMWAGNSVFTNQEAAALVNTKLPVVITMDCLNGSFAEADPSQPSFTTISDSMLFNENGGAAAVWASTSLTNPNVQGPFQQSFYQVVSQSPQISMGEAVRAAKTQGGWSNGTAEVFQSWTLLGDPMLSLSVPSQAAPEPLRSEGGGNKAFSCSAGADDGKGAPGSMGEIGFLAFIFALHYMFNAYRTRRRKQI